MRKSATARRGKRKDPTLTDPVRMGHPRNLRTRARKERTGAEAPAFFCWEKLSSTVRRRRFWQLRRYLVDEEDFPEPRLPVPLAVTTKVPEMTLAVCRPLGPLLSCKPDTAPVLGVMVTVPTS